MWIWVCEFCKGLRHTGTILFLAVAVVSVFLGKKIIGRALVDVGKFFTVYFYRYILRPLWTVA